MGAAHSGHKEVITGQNDFLTEAGEKFNNKLFI